MHTTDPAADAAIRAVIHEWAAATGAKKLEAVLAHQIAEPVDYALPPPLVAEGDVRAGLSGWFATWDGPFLFEPKDIAVTAGGDVAFAHSLMHIKGTKTDGEVSDVWFRQTLGLTRQDGRWVIVHIHHSVPFYMDGSYRAAVDLKPV